MNRRRKTKKRNIIITVFSVIAVPVLAFILYWQFALLKINNFTTVEISDLKAIYDYINIRDADIHYVQKGSGDRIIILLHGIGGGAFTFRNNIDELARAGYRVIAIDLKGFGYSEKVAGLDYSHIEQARIVLDFMEKMEIEKAVIVGHSMGGRIALISYDLSPEKFKSIILIDSAGLEESSPSSFSKLITKPLVDIIYYNLFIKEENFKDFLSSAFYNKSFVDNHVVELYLEPFKIKGSNLAYASIMKGSMPYDIEFVLKKINIPVLIIWGDNDTWIDVGYAYKFNDLIRGSELAIIKNAGHVPMEEQSEATNKKILEFLE